MSQGSKYWLQKNLRLGRRPWFSFFSWPIFKSQSCGFSLWYESEANLSLISHDMRASFTLLNLLCITWISNPSLTHQCDYYSEQSNSWQRGFWMQLLVFPMKSSCHVCIISWFTSIFSLWFLILHLACIFLYDLINVFLIPCYEYVWSSHDYLPHVLIYVDLCLGHKLYLWHGNRI